MRKKNIVTLVIVLLLILVGYLLTSFAFPKNINRYPALVLLFLLDYYVWGLFKKKVFTYSRLIKLLTAFVYWLPMLFLLVSTIVLVFVPGNQWNPMARSVIFGSIFSFYIAKFFMAVVLGLTDLVRLIDKLNKLYLNRKKPVEDTDDAPVTRRKFLENIALLTGGLVVSSMFMGMFKWVHDFTTKRLSISIPGLPDAFSNYRIIQISDLHLGTWSHTDPMEKAVAEINNMNADLIVFTGDLVNYTTDEAYRFKEILTTLKAPDGVLAILGNHDYGDYVNWPDAGEKQKNMEDLYQFYHQIGWKLLRNDHVIISKGMDKIAVIGVETWSQNTRFPRLGSIIKAQKGIGQVSTKILLSHDPSHWDSVVLKEHQDIQLTLSGHTHGFQFGIEIPGLKWSPAQYMYKQWAGLYENESTQQKLYVNRGLGSIGYPGRIGILPEITIFELKS